jgi:hypothetical protein
MKLEQHKHPGCYNREPFRESLVVKSGLSTVLNADGTGVQAFRVITIPFRGSRECHTADDPRCADCKWRPEASK